MASPAELLARLQPLVDRYPEDVADVHAAFADPATPPPARRLLAGALNYALEALDIFPDHYLGLGVVDDAAVLRLAAAAAVAAGAPGAALARLAGERAPLEGAFGELLARLARFVEALPARSVRGRTADAILADQDVRALFDRDVRRAAAALRPQPLPAAGGAERALAELRRMTQHALDKAGIA